MERGLYSPAPVNLYVRKLLSSGTIRFNVAQRDASASVGDPGFSTGPHGEFLRHGTDGLYFQEERSAEETERNLAARRPKTIWDLIGTGEASLKSYLSLAAIIFGILIILLGMATIAAKGAVGAIWIVLGLIIIGTPLVLSARERKVIRSQEEQQRIEVEQIRKRNEEMIGSFAARLNTLPDNHTPEALAAMRTERALKEIPYDAIAPLARNTVIDVGLRDLAVIDQIGPEGLAKSMDDTAASVGLYPDDAMLVKKQFYQKLVWHLLADDRLNAAHEQLLASVQAALGLEDRHIASEIEAIEEFRKLDLLTPANLTQVEVPIKLKFQEVCFHATSGYQARREIQKTVVDDETIRTMVWAQREPVNIYVTSRRLLLVTGKKQTELQYATIFDLETDADDKVLSIVVDGQKVPHTLWLPEPIFSGSSIRLASLRPRKPAGFV